MFVVKTRTADVPIHIFIKTGQRFCLDLRNKKGLNSYAKAFKCQVSFLQTIKSEDLFNKWFAWQHIFFYTGLVHKRSYNNSRLFKIFYLQVIVIILVAVVGFGFVIYRVLYELEARYARPVERQVVVDPVLLMVTVFAPRSLKGANHCSNMGLTPVLPCANIPRILPVPLSRL